MVGVYPTLTCACAADVGTAHSVNPFPAATGISGAIAAEYGQWRVAATIVVGRTSIVTTKARLRLGCTLRQSLIFVKTVYVCARTNIRTLVKTWPRGPLGNVHHF